MSKGDWNLYAAIGLAITIIAGSWLAANSDQYTNSIRQSSAHETDAQLPSVKPQAPPAKYIYSCQYPKDANDTGLCIQVQSRDIANRANFVAWISIWISVLGAVATIVGLVYIAQTLHVTRDAVNLSREDFHRTYRPRIRVRSVRNHGIKPDSPLLFDVYVANVGDSTGKIIQIICDYFYREFHNGKLEFREEILNVPTVEEVVLKVGEQVKFTRPSQRSYSDLQIAHIVGGDARLSIVGTIVYQDEMGTNRITGFVRVYDPKAKVFMKPEQTDPYYDDEFED